MVAELFMGQKPGVEPKVKKVLKIIEIGRRTGSKQTTVYKSIRILRQEIASLKVLPVYKSTPQFANILE